MIYGPRDYSARELSSELYELLKYKTMCVCTQEPVTSDASVLGNKESDDLVKRVQTAASNTIKWFILLFPAPF